MSRRAAIVMLTFFACFLVVATTAKAWLGNLDPNRGDGHRRVLGRGQIRFDGFGPERWALRFRHERQLVDRLRQRLARERYVVLHHTSVMEAIELAGATYGDTATLWRKARCESGLNPNARNLSSAATGLFQFLGSTWASTPYGRFDPTSPYANALAAGWMHANGRGGEWVCRGATTARYASAATDRSSMAIRCSSGRRSVWPSAVRVSGTRIRSCFGATTRSRHGSTRSQRHCGSRRSPGETRRPCPRSEDRPDRPLGYRPKIAMARRCAVPCSVGRRRPAGEPDRPVATRARARREEGEGVTVVVILLFITAAAVIAWRLK